MTDIKKQVADAISLASTCYQAQAAMNIVANAVEKEGDKLYDENLDCSCHCRFYALANELRDE